MKRGPPLWPSRQPSGLRKVRLPIAKQAEAAGTLSKLVRTLSEHFQSSRAFNDCFIVRWWRVQHRLFTSENLACGFLVDAQAVPH